MIFFNGLALGELALSFLCGLVVSAVFRLFGIHNTGEYYISEYIMNGTAGVVLLVMEIVFRYRKIKSANEKAVRALIPDRGGFFMFIPLYLLGVYLIIYNIIHIILK